MDEVTLKSKYEVDGEIKDLKNTYPTEIKITIPMSYLEGQVEYYSEEGMTLTVKCASHKYEKEEFEQSLRKLCVKLIKEFLKNEI
ncbi:hypothetical protein UMC2_35741 [[Clostridium] sordellii]|uniref:hypothetical protein n=1 Tax=Paraclostridium sordellii TaxID=1505 RepID=UPI000543B14E|nr:hypothetical protein [Paeniclostridium sordellii]CEK34363.1 hypothetical protein UMC2_35741 [[Clostridium] sordellii] [Paeniclostridium sordellii]